MREGQTTKRGQDKETAPTPLPLADCTTAPATRSPVARLGEGTGFACWGTPSGSPTRGIEDQLPGLAWRATSRRRQACVVVALVGQLVGTMQGAAPLLGDGGSVVASPYSQIHLTRLVSAAPRRWRRANGKTGPRSMLMLTEEEHNCTSCGDFSSSLFEHIFFLSPPPCHC